MFGLDVSFEELKGKVITAIKGMEHGSDEVLFECSDGSRYNMHHEQDCCESVYIEDVVGDVRDLIGNPILVAEESSNRDDAPKSYDGYEHVPDSYTWTYYKLDTIKGGVSIRWYGESNGYYSESVYFCRVR